MRTLGIVTLALTLAGCRSERRLPVFGEIPPFLLTAQTGAPFRSDAALAGRIWIADFIFTTCQGPCPRMTSQMRSIERRTRDIADVRFVSFTVDPENDTPPVLEAYAKQFNADTTRWSFLTGPQKTLHDLGRYAFKLQNVDGSLTHSTRFVLVDQHGRIRGFYGTTEPSALDDLVADVLLLARERS